MKIKKLETFTKPYVSFLKTTLEDGSQGFGQMSTYHADITARIFHKQVAPWVLDKSWEDFNDIENLVLEKEHKFPGSYLLRAIAGLDTSLWDLKGKLEKKSVTELIGGNTGSLRVYGSSMKRDISAIDEAERFKKLFQEKGINAFKFRIGAECGRGLDEWEGRTEDIVKTINKSLDSSVIKLVDANSCYSATQAIEIGKLLEDHNVTHFEEPCPYWEPEQTKEVTDALTIDVTGGEQDCDIRIWKDMVKRKIVNIYQPDVMYLGGLTRTLQVAKIIEEGGYVCTPHAANLSLVTMCTMHLLKAIPNAGPYLELSIEGEDYYPWQQDLFLDNPFKIENGCVTVTEKPGWGIDINPEWLNNADYQVSEIN
ncbi:mandelate racemase/muconate lactonizing enzyme family protein [Alphaproteobacteria bacterium]|nr:mandelate racemase/muconate lactonizing enzyme family protein [Alphaproteobacteria bacterium]